MPSIAIHRPRLQQLLDDHRDRRVVLVRGPAGVGKTVLVSQWAAEHADACIWLTIDSDHNDRSVLLRHLIELAEQLHLDGVDAVAGSSVVGSGMDDGLLREALIMATHRLGTTLDVVFDEVDRLHDRAARHILRRLIEHPPEAVRLVLVSRSKPRLGLERARLRGDLLEIGPTALRFQRAEVEALASKWTGGDLDADELEQATLGWAAGLRLAQIEAAGDDAPSHPVPDSDGVASEYVREELIHGSSKEVRSFLEVTCWLPTLTGSICAAIASQRAGRAPLTQYDMEALPILPVPSRPGAFRFPPILRSVLQQEYRRRDPGAALRALGRAAEACRRSGEHLTAVELYLQAGQPDDAAEVCAELTAGGESSLRQVDELLHRRPELSAASRRFLPWRIRAAVAAGAVEEASSLLHHADRDTEADDASGEVDSQALAAARAAVAERLGDVTTLLACAERLLASPRPTENGRGADLQAHAWRIRALAWSGDAVGARAALRALEDVAVESTAEVALARAWVAWLDGDMSGTAQNATDARRGEDNARVAEADLLLGSTHRERNQLAKAVSRIQGARTHAGTYAYNVIAALAASELARCHRAAGASMDALELVVSARAAYPGLPLAVEMHLLKTEVLVRLDQGDVGGAHSAVRTALPGIETQLLATRVALKQSSTRAGELLESISTQTPRQAVEKLLLRAVLHGADSTEASLALIKAVASGEPLGLVRTFFDEGPALSRRLSDLAFEHRDRALGRLGALARQELALGPVQKGAPPAEQLTARELAVLRMLPLRMSNREMATQMYVSVNTLKTHIRAIYRKLDVTDRSAAVRRAKALQLV